MTNPNTSIVMTEAYWNEPDSSTDKDDYAVRMTGYFVPPSTGDYKFYVKGDDQTILHFSNVTGDQQSLVRLCYLV